MMERTEVPGQPGVGVRLSTAEVIERLSRFDGPPEQFLATLLAVQCQMASAEGGAILRSTDERRAEVLAVYPALAEGATAPVWLSQAVEFLPEVLTDAATVIKPFYMPDDLYGQPAKRHLIFVPLRRAQAISGLAVFVVETRDPRIIGAIRERLELTVGILSLYEMRLLLQRRQTDLRRLRAAMETLAAVNEQERFAGLAMALCNEVATRWQCDRVSAGFLKGRYVHLRAMSHTEKFNRRMKVVQDIEAAMEECLDQDVEILLPASPEATYVGRAANELSKRHGPSATLAIPLRRAGKALAVLLLERPLDKPFMLEEGEALRLTADLVMARLANLEEHDKWVGARLAGAIRKGAAAAVGPKHTWIKLLVILGAAFLGIIFFVKGDYRHESSFNLEPIQQQVIPAPFDGFIESVLVEPPDQVEGGKTVLATLETVELKLQLAAAKAERITYLKQAAAAMRDAKTAEAQIAQAQADKAKAQGDLLEYQITQAKIVSPMSGLVVAGDLKKRIGAPVKTGDVMFEVAPLESLRAELSVSEDDVPDLTVGQEGELASASFPDERVKFVVERITPVAEVVEQRNVFKVRVRLLDRPSWGRPGMEGVAKVYIGRHSYAWIWTRPAINWVRMKLWI
jgi:multidrug resistance efflux pump